MNTIDKVSDYSKVEHVQSKQYTVTKKTALMAQEARIDLAIRVFARSGGNGLLKLTTMSFNGVRNRTSRSITMFFRGCKYDFLSFSREFPRAVG